MSNVTILHSKEAPFNRQWAEHFLTLLDESAETFTFQTFDDDKSRGDTSLARLFHGSLAEHWEALCELSSRGAGIFISVNKTDGRGRKKANITAIRALWRELDRPGVPELPIEPHIVVESSEGKFHEYVLVDESGDFRLFSGIMARLVADYGSDPYAIDVSRVLRLPGFSHQKDPNKPWLVRIVHESGAQPYSLEEVAQRIAPLTRSTNTQRIPAGSGITNEAEVRSALAALDPDMDYGDWLSVGIALHHATGGGKRGIELWDDWSSQGALYKPGECRYRYCTFGKRDGQQVTLKTLFKLAHEAGWHWQGDTPEVSHVSDETVEPQSKPREDKDRFAALFAKGITASELVLKEFLPEVWAVDGILIEGVTILAGAPKVKKSWLVLGIAIAVASGGIALGHTQVEQGRVLYLALEDRERRLQKRITAVLEGTPASGQLHLFTEWLRLGKGCIEALDVWLSTHPGTRLVIIDTYRRIKPPRKLNADPSDADYDDMFAFAPIAKKHNVAIVIVHHTRKGQSEDIVEEISGTQGLAGSVDSILIMKRERGAASAFLYVTGRDIENETTYAMDWDERTCTWHIKGEGDDFKGSSERRQVIEFIKKNGPADSKQITGWLYPDITVTRQSKEWAITRQLLGRMLRDGVLEIDALKLYRLPTSDN